MEQKNRTPRPFDKERMRIFAFDLDGTLLNGSDPIHNAVSAALMKLSEAGCTVAAASGRNATQIDPHLRSHFRYIVGSNGAFITDTASGKNVYSRPMDQKTVLSALRILNQYGARAFVQQGNTMISPTGAFPMCVLREVRMSSRMLRDFSERVRVFYGGCKICTDSAKRVRTDADPFYKLQAFFPDTAKAEPAFKALEPLGLTVLMMGDRTLEITAPGVSKANALKALSQMLSLTEENICAFGDSRNDTEMLGRAGYAVVMGNGTDEAKALADTIAPPVWEDGVAKALETLYFGE